MTCWRRIKRWTDAGVFDDLPQILLVQLNAANWLGWSRAVIDGSHADAKKGGPGTGPSPVNRAEPGSKHHLICDGHGTPNSVLTSGANVPDTKGYDSEAFRQACRERGTQPVVPRRTATQIKGLGKLRYIVDQTIALLHQFRRLATR